MDARGKKFLDEIIDSGSLPSLSPLAVKLMSLAAREDSTPRDMARIIEADPALTARLLSLVNSTMYRRSDTQITNITRAVMLLGVREVRIMALSLSLRDTLPAGKTTEMDYTLFWRINVQRAILAQRIAQVLNLPHPEEAFTAGLIVDVGLPVMLKNLSAEVRASYPGLGVPRDERMAWETREVGINHRQLGVAIVEHWNLPPFFAACMHYPAQGGAEVLPKIVDFADFAAESCVMPRWSFTQIHLQGRKELALSSEQVNQVIADTLEVGGQVAQALEVDMNQEQDTLAIMEKANEALRKLSIEVTPKLQKVVQKAALLSNQRLQEETISNTLEAVMHEIRNPLMSVGGFARRLARQKENADSTQRYAQVILDEANRLDAVLGKVSMLLAPVQPVPLKTNLTEIMEKIKARLEGFAAVWLLPPGSLWLVTDGQLLEEALILLLHYAAHNQRPLEIKLALHNGRAKVIITGSGELPGGREMAMEERAFGPELNLVRIRRIMEGLEGDLETTLDSQGFTLTLSICVGN